MARERVALWALIAALGAPVLGWSEPPPAIEAQLTQIGRVVDPTKTAAIYGPLLASQSYAGVVFNRDVAYGPDPRNILDVAAPAAPGTGLRPVLINAPGGAGDKVSKLPNAAPFYDNIALWAVRNGMVAVNAERRSGPGAAWDAGGQDIGQTIAWTRQNIRKYGGDPDRIVIWGQSAGAGAISVYLSHKALWPDGAVGVKGAVLTSGTYNLAPLGAGGGRTDPAVELQRSSLEGFKTLTTPLYVSSAELDPDQMQESARLLNQVLCQAGRCPRLQVNKGESHMSQGYSVNTGDTGVTAPILAWIKTVD